MLGTVAIDRLPRRCAPAAASRPSATSRRSAARLGVSGDSAVPVGDDCAAIPDGDGYLLFAIEGFMNEFVAGDPWFAGWCGVMVNISDIAAMGGRPIAVVDAVWAASDADAEPVLAGMRAASRAFGVPIVGGHTNIRTDRGQLSVAILGRAKRLLTTFDATPGDRLVAAIDLRGRYREPFSNWEAATDAPPARLRGDLEVLPAIAEAGLALRRQGHQPGRHRRHRDDAGGMLGRRRRRSTSPRFRARTACALERWLQTFPSFGYLLAVAPSKVAAVIGRFAARGIAAPRSARSRADSRVAVTDGRATETIWDFDREPLIGCGQARLEAEALA